MYSKVITAKSFLNCLFMVPRIYFQYYTLCNFQYSKKSLDYFPYMSLQQYINSIQTAANEEQLETVKKLVNEVKVVYLFS